MNISGFFFYLALIMGTILVLSLLGTLFSYVEYNRQDNSWQRLLPKTFPWKLRAFLAIACWVWVFTNLPKGWL